MSEVRWTPGIGDPSLMGWLTVAAYFIAALLCWRAGRMRADERKYWMLLAIVLTLLGINKQLDLQSWFTQVGRDIALAMGWYDVRGVIQRLFIELIVAMSLIILSVAYWFTRGHGTYLRVAVGGFAVLLAFVLIRASSFHHVDMLIGTTIGGARLNWEFELGGIAIIGLAARFSVRS